MVDYLKSQGNGVGKSTVYRYLEKLVEEGKVRKYFLEEGAGACFPSWLAETRTAVSTIISNASGAVRCSM